MVAACIIQEANLFTSPFALRLTPHLSLQKELFSKQGEWGNGTQSVSQTSQAADSGNDDPRNEK